jgi:hypothetical protein
MINRLIFIDVTKTSKSLQTNSIERDLREDVRNHDDVMRKLVIACGRFARKTSTRRH